MIKVSDAYHIPVLLKQCIEGLKVKPDGIYVDVTFGGGGHSKAIMNELGKEGRLVAFDQDPEAAANAPLDDRFELIEGNFAWFKNFLKERGIRKVDGVLADLGVSSHQINKPERGFSFRFDAPLDMRMSKQGEMTAAMIANRYTEAELKQMLWKYGELRNAGRVATSIVRARSGKKIKTVFDLKKAIAKLAPKGRENSFYARVFQAFRIEVNKELEALEYFLLKTGDVISKGGRLVVISYHSLEDRMVKNYMRAGNIEGKIEKDFYGNILRPFKPLVSKAIRPDEEEILINNRARSARLRIAERL